jgi:hypothetical protein
MGIQYGKISVHNLSLKRDGRIVDKARFRIKRRKERTSELASRVVKEVTKMAKSIGIKCRKPDLIYSNSIEDKNMVVMEHEVITSLLVSNQSEVYGCDAVQAVVADGSVPKVALKITTVMAVNKGDTNGRIKKASISIDLATADWFESISDNAPELKLSNMTIKSLGELSKYEDNILNYLANCRRILK